MIISIANEVIKEVIYVGLVTQDIGLALNVKEIIALRFKVTLQKIFITGKYAVFLSNRVASLSIVGNPITVSSTIPDLSLKIFKL